MSIEPVEPGTICVWCWKEISEGQPVLDLGKGAKAHLGCDANMLGFIESLGEWTE